MQMQQPVSDPFALMMDPASVVQAMESSDRLARLQRRVYRPLDKPLIARKKADSDAFDRAIDAQPDEQSDAATEGGEP